MPDVPLRHAVANHRPGIARGFAISALGSITYYVGITYVPSFLTSVGNMMSRPILSTTLSTRPKFSIFPEVARPKAVGSGRGVAQSLPASRR